MAQKPDPNRATPGRWITIPTHMTMHYGERVPAFAVLATGPDVCEQFIGRVYPKTGSPDERLVVEMDTRLFAAFKAMTIPLLQVIAYKEETFEADKLIGGRVVRALGAKCTIRYQ